MPGKDPRKPGDDRSLDGAIDELDRLIDTKAAEFTDEDGPDLLPVLDDIVEPGVLPEPVAEGLPPPAETGDLFAEETSLPPVAGPAAPDEELAQAEPGLDQIVKDLEDIHAQAAETSSETAPDAAARAEAVAEDPFGLDSSYDPSRIEQDLYASWEQTGQFVAGSGDGYCIMLPPPNVTGSLHMGHAFQDTLMDALVRFQRMCGKAALWQSGTDHAGIATQMVVERRLAAEGKSRHDLGREAFESEVWNWKAESGGTITRQLRRMGAAIDWNRERFTLDEGLSRAVTEVFVRLYEEDLLYRGKRLVNWDPVLHTAISDLEVVSEDEAGHLWHIRYPLVDGQGHVVVATTRPETLLGDQAVAVNPEDERYRHLIGRELHLPLTGRVIPIIGDDYVDAEFGSGCVKITPAHDFNDYEVGLRHNLECLNIFTPDAALNDAVPPAYQGLDRYEARKRVVEDLTNRGLLDHVEDHRHKVPRGDRSHSVVEPYLTDQWYVRAKPLAAPAIAAVQNGDIRFVPENWSKTYFEWMRNIEDWCISRQLWWGHRIPAWYDEDGQVYVGRDEAEARAQGGLAETVTLTRDPDVLDTWFSSALWPFSTLGWPDKTPELQRFYPTNVLVTGFDIIFFWVARMVMMGLKFTGEVPFREVYIHGLVRDADGQKMSKSKGNVLDPLDLIDGIDLESLVQKRKTGLMKPEAAPTIEKSTRRQFPDGIPSYGTDALRFTFASLATQGRDVVFELGRIEGNRNFCNKLWNASRFVLNELAKNGYMPGSVAAEDGLAEQWIRDRFTIATKEVREGFAAYRFDLAAKACYEFAWHEFCDWYLELAKITLREAGPSRRQGTLRCLAEMLDGLLRLLHPLMPFITESLWLRSRDLLGVTGDGLLHVEFPVSAATTDAAVAEEFTWLQDFIIGVRQVRGEMNISPGKPLAVMVAGSTQSELRYLADNHAYLRGMARLTSIEPAPEEPPESATALAGETTILVPLADIIDPVAEQARLEKELKKLHDDRERVAAKLANENFVARAPESVVAKEREKIESTDSAIARLEEQLERIKKLRR